ncbi:MAG TPA: hypothetical protein VEG30_04150 [Terriglobales bacterium]|nr:hypothetical protein [Terriglobales bacterium]
MGYLALLRMVGVIGALTVLLNVRSLSNDRTRDAMRESARNVTGLGDEQSLL